MLAYPYEHLFGTLGLVRLSGRKEQPAVGERHDVLSEPGAGKRHAGFDEQDVETGLWQGY